MESASPAVVNISTKQHVQARGAAAQMPDLEGLPPIFREFFGHSFPAPPEGQQPDAQSLGSGFIIAADGYVLTNNHVVADADEIIVRLPDRSELEATLVGADPRTDVTAGIVSATGRNLPSESYVPFIQTDVAINPGNSGGPLFNLQGEVIGINSQIFTRSGGFMGLSFAIPIDVAMDVADQLRTEGKVSRGWLGVAIQEVNRDLAESFGLERPAGALVAQVMDGGPAAKGGLRVGDVILSVDGHAIDMSADLPHLIGAIKPNTKAKLEIVRDGERETLTVQIGALPDEGEEAAAAERNAEKSNNRLGVKVSELTAEQKRSLDLPGGVVITEVSSGPAAMIGLRPGDVITHLNNQAIDSVSTFTRVAEQLPKNRSVSMRVLRQGRASFITFKLAE